jgi:hypothetical protein
MKAGLPDDPIAQSIRLRLWNAAVRLLLECIKPARISVHVSRLPSSIRCVPPIGRDRETAARLGAMMRMGLLYGSKQLGMRYGALSSLSAG